MASFGAKYPCFAKIADEPASALPTYEGFATIGRLVKADLSLSFASGKLYADDSLAESVDEFVSGTISMETDDVADEVAALIYGATVKEEGATNRAGGGATVNAKEVTYSAGDSAPMGGLAYYKALMRNGVKLYKGYYYPRVKATLGGDTAETKGDSITFGTSTTEFTVFECSSGAWRITKEFDTEDEAAEWVGEMLDKDEDGGGSGAGGAAESL